ncbi:hypothetical protein [Flagellimonas pacifica]|uniref:Uncharacterized protein n=1 Tax=Flagellimonas pacifica TaxID=1247520 RepID=A0A285N1D4_9FLAO|nr:hypothetical protein [Allomuricauda parva]SNZ01816.1 hypothetical protein SAMN06265377_3663 [Allomuricauda parva]
MLNKKEETYLSELIKDRYGSKEALAEILDLGIEMLFYVEENSFNRKEIQSVVSALRDMVVVLRESK